MKIHKIKLNIEFCDDVLSGRKNFEIRFNDRGYQAGDLVQFIPVKLESQRNHEIQNVTFQITYVLGGWGLKEDWVVFGIKRYDPFADIDGLDQIAEGDKEVMTEDLQDMVASGFSLHNIALVIKQMIKEVENDV